MAVLLRAAGSNASNVLTCEHGQLTAVEIIIAEVSEHRSAFGLERVPLPLAWWTLELDERVDKACCTLRVSCAFQVGVEYNPTVGGACWQPRDQRRSRASEENLDVAVVVEEPS